MLSYKKANPILVISPDEEFLRALNGEAAGTRNPPTLTLSGKEAVSLLMDTERAYSGIFIETGMPLPGTSSLLRYARQYRPGVPAFLVHLGDLSLRQDELDKLGVQKALEKPLSYETLARLVLPVVPDFQKAPPAPEDSDSTESEEGDAAFAPVRATDFVSGNRSFFDIHVRLPSGKYVKILRAGDTFSTERLESYLEKQVTHFHIRKDAQELFLSYFDQIAEKLLHRRNTPVELKTSRVFAHGEQTLSFLRNQGVSEASIQHARSFIHNTHELVLQLACEPASSLRIFLDNVAAYEHGVGTAAIAAVLAPHFQIRASKTVEILGVASLLHDIGLYALPKHIQDENNTHAFTDGELKLFQTHPRLGADILKTIKGLHSSVAQGALFHHQRRTKKGFPARDPHSETPRVAEVVGIADELARLIQRAAKNPVIDFRRELEYDIFNGFSHAVVQAFRKSFAALL